MNENHLQRTFRLYQRSADPALLAKVFDATAPGLLSLARHLAPDEASAEDAVQATFLSAMERAEHYDSRRPLSPWLAGILARHARRARRIATRRPDPERAALDPPADPVQHAQRVEARETLVSVLDRLRPTDREVLAPFLIEAERPATIATALGISPNATYVRLHRALGRLRRALPVGLAPALVAVPAPPTPRGLEAVREDVVQASEGRAPQLGTADAAAAASAPASLVIPALIALGLASVGALVGFTRSESPADERGDALAVPAREGQHVESIAAADASARARTVQADASAATEEVHEARATPAELVAYRGIVADWHGQVLEGAEVWLTAAPDGGPPARLVARSDAGGRYRFEAEPSAQERLRIHKAGFADFRMSTAGSFREIALQELGVSVGADGKTWLGMANLRPAARVRGRVIDADGAPVAGAALTLFRPFMDPRGDYVDAKTRADGSFVLEGGVPWLFRERKEPWILCATSVLGCGWAELAVPAGTQELADVTIALRPGRDLEVLVVDAEGSPVPDVTLRAVPRHGPWARIPDRFSESEPIPTDERFGAVSGPDGVARFRSLPLFEGPESGFVPSVTIEGTPVSIYRVVVTDAGWRAREEGLFLLAPPTSTAEAYLTDAGMPDRLVVEPRPDANER